MKKVTLVALSLCFLVVGALVGGGVLKAPFFSNQRVPASSEGELPFFEDLEVVPEQGALYLQKPETSSFCDSYKKIQYELIADGVASFSHQGNEDDGKIKLLATLSCDRAVKTPIFFDDYCGSEPKRSWSREGIDFELLNDQGFFPKNWYVSSVRIFNEEVTDGERYEKSPSDEGLNPEIFKVSCDLLSD